MQTTFINLKNNLLTKSEENITNFSFNFSTSLFDQNSKYYNLFSKLHWVYDTYLNSIEYEAFNVKKYEPEFNKIKFQKNIYFPYKVFIENLFNELKEALNVFSVTKDNLYNLHAKTNYKKENIENIIEKTIEKEVEKFYEESLNNDFIVIKYSFAANNETSDIQFICKNLNSRVKINNSSKLIPQIIMKRAVNRLSIVSNKLNEDFRKIGKTRPMYKVFFAGRRNGFEEIDKSIKESILKGGF